MRSTAGTATSDAADHVYNKNLVAAADIPEDWDDLLKPAFKGRLVVRFPLDSGTMRAPYLAMIDRQIAKGRTLDQAIDWMQQLEGAVCALRALLRSSSFRSWARASCPFSFWNVAGDRHAAAPGLSDRLRLSGLRHADPARLRRPGEAQQAHEHPLVAKLLRVRDVEGVRGPALRVDRSTGSERARVAASWRAPDYMDAPTFQACMPVDWRRVSEAKALWMSRWEKEVAGQAKAKH